MSIEIPTREHFERLVSEVRAVSTGFCKRGYDTNRRRA
jgi:hypothetical protein